MPNIIEIIDEIGKEVEIALKRDDHREYFMQSLLLYSLTENILKYLVATKILWNETCKQVDKLDAGEEYLVDFGEIRNKTKRLSFKNAIDQAKSLQLIDERLRNRINEIREERNDLIHELYVFRQRNNKDFMKRNLVKIQDVVIELCKILEKLIYDEIGVDIPEVLETL